MTRVVVVTTESPPRVVEVTRALPRVIEVPTRGAPGAPGPAGASAYQVALAAGFSGDYQEWLDSLVGKSAYQLALEAGFSGSQEEWLLQASGLIFVEGDEGRYLTIQGGTPRWVEVSKLSLGLGNVDNTSDADKPISSAVQQALELKLNITDFESRLQYTLVNSVIDLGELGNGP